MQTTIYMLHTITERETRHHRFTYWPSDAKRYKNKRIRAWYPDIILNTRTVTPMLDEVRRVLKKQKSTWTEEWVKKDGQNYTRIVAATPPLKRRKRKLKGYSHPFDR